MKMKMLRDDDESAKEEEEEEEEDGNVRGYRNEELRALAECDVAAKRRECPFTPPWCPRGFSMWMEAGLADTRDRVMAELLTCICMVTLPLATCVFAMESLHVMGGSRRGTMLMHAVGMTYLIFNEATFLQRFVLTLHYSEHRGLWAKTAKTTTTTTTTTRSGDATSLLSTAVSIVRGALVPMLCPFFGVPPGVYRLHHCVMHHVEANGCGDMTSTQRFQRDSALHFVLYVAAMLASILLLPVYALTRARRVDLAARSAVAILAYAVAMRGLYARAPIATLYVFMLPLVIVFAALAFGNWSQHLFITHQQSTRAHGDTTSAGAEGGRTHDKKKKKKKKTKLDTVNLNQKYSQSAYTMAYNCIAAAENQTTYNDGYHVVHHANSRTHWSELPRRFIDTLDIHEANATLVFRDVHFMEVGAAATFGGERGLRWLATKLVSYDARKKSHRGDANVFDDDDTNDDDDDDDDLDNAMKVKVHILRDRLAACCPPPPPSSSSSLPAPPRPRRHH